MSEPTTEDLVAAYDAADKETKLLVRQLVRADDYKSAKLVTEILHFFPGARVVKH